MSAAETDPNDCDCPRCYTLGKLKGDELLQEGFGILLCEFLSSFAAQQAKERADASSEEKAN